MENENKGSTEVVETKDETSTGKTYTEEEREKLRALFLAGVPINEIAIILERSETAVYQQIQQMHLYVRAPESSRKRRSVTGDSKCLCAACTCDRALCPLQERSRQGEEVT